MKKFCTALCFSLLLINSLQAQVKINEVYGGGGNSGAVWTNDFIELYNPTASPVSLAGWSVQYASSTGSTWAVTALSGTIAANGYYLVQQAQGAGGTTPLPTPNATGTIAMSGTAGKIILCNVTTAQSGTNPTSAAIVDKVGYGSANGFEGAGPATAPSNTASVQRSSPGFDTDNNNTDFVLLTPPTPTNATVDVTPPTITLLSPANAATGVAPSVLATFTFNEAVQKGTGNIIVKKNSDNSIILTLDVTGTLVTLTGNTASFLVQGLDFSTSYYVEMAAGTFKDNANNNFAGIAGSSTWSFTVTAQPTGTLGTTYDFATCGNHFFSGFTQYSVTGPQLWACTTFGRDAANPPLGSAPNGLQINGFSTTNITNEDWLISPSFDLTGTTFPLLSFWSRTRFNGAPLRLKVSTNYPGTGNPNNYTWTDINGKFPAQTSDSWTLSNNINLSAFKTTNTYFAFVYNSTVDDGARWTLDDISIINSATPPPPSLTVSLTDVQFGYAPAGGSVVKTFTVTGNDITGDITLTANSVFGLSATVGGPFTTSLTLLQASANNTPVTVYAQYAPVQNDLTDAGTATIGTASVTNLTVNLRGTSIDPAKTLEVVNWNIEWFGSPTLGPANDAQQQANVQTVLQNIGADIYGMVEVVDESRFAAVVSNLPGYAYVISNFGSHTNPNSPTPSTLAEAQKQAFIYKTSVFSNVTTQPLLSQGINSAADITNPAYNSFASGRFPFMFTADVTLAGVTKTVRFVLMHAKANTSPTATSYARRKAGSDTLHYTLNNLYPNDNIVVLGDINDDLDQTITDGIVPPLTSYTAFTNNSVNYPSPTLALSLAGRKSTVSYNDMIDHVILSSEMKTYYMNASANVLDDVSSLVSNYGTTTTDHYPVFTRYAFDAALLPVRLLSFTAVREGAAARIAWTTASEENLASFVVERSLNGSSNWQAIATVAPTGAGSGGAASYTLTDASPVNGYNYYRLKSVDRDGKLSYSAIRSLRFDKAIDYTLYPNPAGKTVTIQQTSATGFNGTVALYNQNGQLVVTKRIVTTAQQFELNVASLSAGLYFVKMTNLDGAVSMQKLVKE
jgi:hypothetical protein